MLDVAAMHRWLRSDAVVAHDGAVLSWNNAAHPGYAYPEAAALLVLLLASRADDTALRERVVARLVRDIGPDGGVGRGACAYAFDTALALRALLSVDAEPARVRRVGGFVCDTLAARRAFRGEPGEAPTRWSLAYAPHLLKTCIALCDWEPRGGGARARETVAQLTADLVPRRDGGRFLTDPGSQLTYVHAHCYAVEGLLALRARGWPGFDAAIAAGAAWLADVQQPDGGLRAWHDGLVASGDAHGDATAQAARIWACTGEAHHAAARDRALGFLARLQTPAGGLRYRPGSDDVNTWVTIFAVASTDEHPDPARLP